MKLSKEAKAALLSKQLTRAYMGKLLRALARKIESGKIEEFECDTEFGYRRVPDPANALALRMERNGQDCLVIKIRGDIGSVERKVARGLKNT